MRTEHETLRNELEYIQLADRGGFKYSWSAEHHFLDEYSHLSDSETFMAYALAKTERIHVGSAIFNITPPVNHPARIAERVAMLDHLGEGRFEFGTGRGSSSTEVYGFGIDEMERTRELYDEALPQIVRMWDEDDYSYDGKRFSMPDPPGAAQALHRPAPADLGGRRLAGHVREGRPPRHRRAVLHPRRRPTRSPRSIEIYKKNIEKAEPVGGYVNNNIMVTGDMLCLEDGDRARRLFAANRSNYHTGLVFKYLDSFPRPEGFPVWPDLPPEPTVAGAPAPAPTRRPAAWATPTRSPRTHPEVRRHRRRPADLLVHGVRLRHGRAARVVRDVRHARCIPRFDTDPVHSTTRQREAQCGASYGTR